MKLFCYPLRQIPQCFAHSGHSSLTAHGSFSPWDQGSDRAGRDLPYRTKKQSSTLGATKDWWHSMNQLLFSREYDEPENGTFPWSTLVSIEVLSGKVAKVQHIILRQNHLRRAPPSPQGSSSQPVEDPCLSSRWSQATSNWLAGRSYICLSHVPVALPPFAHHYWLFWGSFFSCFLIKMFWHEMKPQF